MAINPRGRWFWPIYLSEGIFGIYFAIFGAFGILKECAKHEPMSVKVASGLGVSIAFFLGIGLAETADRLMWRRKKYKF